jgi:hypothetical protein
MDYSTFKAAIEDIVQHHKDLEPKVREIAVRPVISILFDIESTEDDIDMAISTLFSAWYGREQPDMEWMDLEIEGIGEI